MHQSIEAEGKNIRFVRMNNGEDLVTEIKISVDNEHYIFINPLRILYNIAKEKDPESVLLSFVPWIFTSFCNTQEFPVFPSDVLTMTEPTEEIMKCYDTFLEKMRKYKTENIISDKRTIEDSMEDMTDEDVEMIQDVLDNIERASKRKLH